MPRHAHEPPTIRGLGNAWHAPLLEVASEPGTTLMIGALVMLATAVAIGAAVSTVAILVAAVAALVAWHREIVRWSVGVAIILCTALFVPFGRYSLPADLPFGLELYRLAVAVMLIVWAGALLTDPGVRLRRSPFDVPLAVITAATLGSIVVNVDRVVPLESAVLKSVTLFVSFVLVYYFVVSVIRTTRAVEKLAKILVAGTAAVALFAVVEQRTRFNIFDHVQDVLPFLHFNGPVDAERDGLVRAVASAQHPIALGVLLAMTVPVGLALASGSSRRWWGPTALIAVGVMSTISRTPILVLLAAGVTLLWLRPKQVGIWVPLVVPLLVLVKLLLPGSLATVKNAFLPEEGILVEQTRLAREADPLLAGGRIRQLGPTLGEASRTPILGQGFATRQTGFDNPLRNAPILDNQWLGLLLEVGLVGVIGWAALMVGGVRRLARESRIRAGPEGWLAAGFAASITGFAAGMLTYDSLAFGQDTFVFWLILALSASLLLAERTEKLQLHLADSKQAA